VIRLAAAVALVLGCSTRYPPLDDHQLEVALAAQANVRTGELYAHVERLYEARLADPAKDFGFGRFCRSDADCPYSRAAAADLIRAHWNDTTLAGARFSEETATADGVATTNLLLDIPGRVRPEEWVLATAHYDAWFGGANDNATGTAVLLEAAAPLLAAWLDRSVRLVLFDGEELGLVGAGRYVAAHGADRVVVVLNADSIAFVGDEGGVLTGTKPSVEYLAQANEVSAGFAFQLADLARRLPEPTEMQPLVFPDDGISLLGVITGFDLGDHAQFWLAGTPAVFPFPAGDKPSWYHTEGDTPDKVDRGRLARMGRLWVAALAAFATLER
jgi:Zn-dependent M28 family amino/carboxypeptidase